ncbi:MAG: PEP-CTERM sorting domain-containing protein [Phycisphaeraceae bacterium]
MIRLRPLSVSLFFSAVPLIAPPAHAVLLPAYTAGQGEHTAQLVLDFGFVGGAAYLFEYRFDGSATSEDMLLTLDAEGALNLSYRYFDFGGGPSIFIDGFEFAGRSAVPGFEGDAGESWSFLIVDPRLAGPIPWVGASTGPTDRPLDDGAVDGWVLNVSPFNSKGLEPTNNLPALPAAVLTAGDTDADGDIDDTDLSTAFTNYTGPVGDAGDASYADGDTDHDRDVDDLDLGTLFSNYTGPASQNGVPEPASAALLALAAAALLRRRG